MIKRVLQHFFKQKNVILLLILSIIVFLFVIIGITVSQVDFTLKDIPSDIEE